MIKNVITGISVMSTALCMSACAHEEAVELSGLSIEHETEFGGAYLHISIDDFLQKGYAFGDSVRVEFSNGTVLEDLPFFNGYYVARGEPLLIGYPGYPYIKAVRNSDDDIWVIYDLSEEDTASVSLEEKGKYLSVMEERNLNPLNDRDAFESDEIFASLCPLKGGSLKENLLFRSSSPIDNTWQRAKYADELCEKYGIRCIVNPADSEEKLQELLETSDSPCYKKLYEQGKVLFPEISIALKRLRFRQRSPAL